MYKTVAAISSRQWGDDMAKSGNCWGGCLHLRPPNQNFWGGRVPPVPPIIAAPGTKHQFIHLLTATLKNSHIENSKNHKR